jgi:hypothetical protein
VFHGDAAEFTDFDPSTRLKYRASGIVAPPLPFICSELKLERQLR